MHIAKQFSYAGSMMQWSMVNDAMVNDAIVNGQ